jgi:hypothetical protein
LGRSLAHLVKVIEDLEARGVHFMTAEDGLSTKGSTGKLVLNMLGAIAQFERNLMLERTRAGLAVARARDRVGGRRRKMGPAEVIRGRPWSAFAGVVVAGQAHWLDQHRSSNRWSAPSILDQGSQGRAGEHR